MRRHRSPGTPAASDPSDSSTNSGSFKCLAEDVFFQILLCMLMNNDEHICPQLAAVAENIGSRGQEIHQSVPSISSVAASDLDTPSKLGSMQGFLTAVHTYVLYS